MGVHADRMFTSITGPFDPITSDLAAPPPGTMTSIRDAVRKNGVDVFDDTVLIDPRNPQREVNDPQTVGFLISHEYNDAYTLTNRLLKAAVPVYWLTQPYSVTLHKFAPGTLWIPNSPAAFKLIDTARRELGINVFAVRKKPSVDALQIHSPRIALVDVYFGSMPSGWTRWLLEQFEFPFTVVYPQQLDAGNLNASYDDIIFPDGTLPNLTPTPAAGAATAGDAPRAFGQQPAPDSIPEEYRSHLGRITAAKTLPQLKAFVEAGGTMLTIGSSTRIYRAMDLPIEDAITEVVKGKVQPVPSERYYIPGSLIRAQVDNTSPVAYGMPNSVDVFFDNSPAYHLAPEAATHGIQTIAWYGQGKLLDSGWAWGETYLNNSVAVAQANVGKGRVLLFGPEIAFRGQPHGTFKFLFNGLLYGAATPTTLH